MATTVPKFSDAAASGATILFVHKLPVRLTVSLGLDVGRF